MNKIIITSSLGIAGTVNILAELLMFTDGKMTGSDSIIRQFSLVDAQFAALSTVDAKNLIVSEIREMFITKLGLMVDMNDIHWF